MYDTRMLLALEIFNTKLQKCYLTDLGGLCIASTLHLVGSPLCKPDAEEPQHVAISGLNINMGLNQGLPLPDQRPQLVCSKIHTLRKMNRLAT